MIVDNIQTPSDKSPSPPLTVSTPDKSISPKIEKIDKIEKIEKTEKIENPVDLIGDVTAWPSLSESTRLPKSALITTTEPPVTTASQAPAVSDSPPSHRQPSTNPTPNPNPIFPQNPNRQKFSGRGGSNRGGPSRGGYVRHPPPPQQLPPPPPLPPPFYGFEQGPIRGPFFYNNNFGPQPQHSPSLRGHHYSRPIRPGFHPRDVRFPQPGPPMSYPISPQPMVPFPFITPMLPPEPFMGMPQYTGGHGPVPPPSLSPPLANHLETKLVNQINYYFSDENLVKDMYLRSQMDEGGWVPITLIANFNKVRELTQDIQLILESLGTSAVVEVQGSKIRRRNDWRRWIPTTSSPQETATGLNTIRAVAV